MALPSSGALEGARSITEYRATGHVPERLTPQRAQALERIGERLGLVRELAIVGGVSDGVIRGLVKAGAIEAIEVAIDDPFPIPRCRPRPAGARTRAERSGGRASAPPSPPPNSRLICSTASPDRARPRSISRRSPRRSAPGARPSSCSPRSRSPSLSSSASPPASAAIRCPGIRAFASRSAAAPGAPSRAARRGSSVGARSSLFLPYPKLGLIVVDEAHEASFKQEDGVQYHARDVAVMRAKLEEIPIILASATPAIETRHMAEIGTYQGAEAARPLWRRAPARHGRARPAPGPAAARPLAGARAGPGARGEFGGGRAEPALPQPPRLRAAHLVPPLRLPLPMPQLHRLDGRAPLHAPARLPPLRPCHAGAPRLPGMQGGGQPRRLRPRRRANRRRGPRFAPRGAHHRSSPPTRSGPRPRRPSSSPGWRPARSTSSSAPSSSPRAIISPTSPWSAWSTPISASPAATCAPPSAASSRSARSRAAPAAARSRAGSSSRPTTRPRR